MSQKTWKLATRGSKLALSQAGLVAGALEALGETVETVIVSTKGDRDRTSPLTAIGGQGLFVREVEQCLLDGSADLAVHSGKDLPYELAEGLVIGGVPKAASAGDLLIARKYVPVRVVGTGSPRRIAEGKTVCPEADFEPIRGNVDTRLQKLRDGQYDAILLAKAGLERLTAEDGRPLLEHVLAEFDCREFTPEQFLPAPCQGILAAECRAEDTELRALLEQISDPPTRKRFDAERALFSRLEADCSVALGVYCRLSGNEYELSALYHETKTTKRGTDLSVLCDTIVQELIP